MVLVTVRLSHDRAARSDDRRLKMVRGWGGGGGVSHGFGCCSGMVGGSGLVSPLGFCA